jgi:hypothetical protein
MDRRNFVHEMVLLIQALSGKGYSVRRLIGMTRRLIAMHPGLFPFSGGRCGIFFGIQRNLRRNGVLPGNVARRA